MKIVDLSVPLEDNPSEPVRPKVDFEDHERTAPLVAGIFGCEVSQLPEGKGWASETVTAITHAGTHVDAPYHYFPTWDDLLESLREADLRDFDRRYPMPNERDGPIDWLALMDWLRFGLLARGRDVPGLAWPFE